MRRVREEGQKSSSTINLLLSIKGPCISDLICTALYIQGPGKKIMLLLTT